MSHDTLANVLARYPAIAQPSADLEPLGNAGGGSGARLWRFVSGCGVLVARAWPIDGPKRADVERIHRWVGAGAELGFLPIPIRGLDGRTVQECGGTLWELAPWMPGVQASHLPATIARFRAAFAALAAFHQCLAFESNRGPSPGLRARLFEIEDWCQQGFEKLAVALTRSPDDRRRALAAQWLRLAESTAPAILRTLQRAAGLEFAIQPCLRDVRPEHILFDDERVSGLVDFGAMAMECVAADLARLLTEWPGPDRNARAEALNAYASIRRLEVNDSSVIDVFATSSALLGAGHWARWHFLEERPFADPAAIEQGLERGLSRLHGTLAELRR